jgi:hypothetical protein
MIYDPIVNEVRRVRKEIENECRNDPKKYFDHIQKVQGQYSERLVSRKPKPALKLAKIV